MMGWNKNYCVFSRRWLLFYHSSILNFNFFSEYLIQSNQIHFIFCDCFTIKDLLCWMLLMWSSNNRNWYVFVLAVTFWYGCREWLRTEADINEIKIKDSTVLHDDIVSWESFIDNLNPVLESRTPAPKIKAGYSKICWGTTRISPKWHYVTQTNTTHIRK